MLAAVILNSDSVKSAIRCEIRRTTEINVEEEIIERVLREEVIKCETIEGAIEAEAACRRVNKSADKKIVKRIGRGRRRRRKAAGDSRTGGCQACVTDGWFHADALDVIV